MESAVFREGRPSFFDRLQRGVAAVLCAQVHVCNNSSTQRFDEKASDRCKGGREMRAKNLWILGVLGDALRKTQCVSVLPVMLVLSGVTMTSLEVYGECHDVLKSYPGDIDENRSTARSNLLLGDD